MAYIFPNSTIEGTSLFDSIFLKNTQSVEIPSGYGITSIPGSVLSFQPNLTDVSIGEGVTSLERTSYWGGITFTNNTLNNYNQGGVFQNDASLTNVHLPSTLTNIGGCAFAYCSNLDMKDFVFTGTIETAAFYGCSKIETIDWTVSNSELWMGDWTGSTNADWKTGYTKIFARVAPKKVKISGAKALDVERHLSYDATNLTTLDFGTECAIVCNPSFKTLTSSMTYVFRYPTDVVIISQYWINSAKNIQDTVGGEIRTRTTEELKIYVPDALVDTYKNSTTKHTTGHRDSDGISYSQFCGQYATRFLCTDAWSSLADYIHPLSEYVED